MSEKESSEVQASKGTQAPKENQDTVFQVGTKVLFLEGHDDSVVYAGIGATGTVEAGSKSQKALTDPNMEKYLIKVEPDKRHVGGLIRGVPGSKLANYD